MCPPPHTHARTHTHTHTCSAKSSTLDETREKDEFEQSLPATLVVEELTNDTVSPSAMCPMRVCCVCGGIYIYIKCVCVYIYVYIYVYVHIYIHIYIERERVCVCVSKG